MIILELKNLTKYFDGIKAVDNISIGFEKGKITALIGPNGAGKTTIFNLINGFIRPEKGSVFFKDKNITGLPPWRVASMGIGRLFQDVRVFNKMNIIDNILCAFKGQKGEIFYFPVLARWAVKKEEQSIKEKAIKLLEFVNLINKTNDLAENLSYGEQKLLAIARLLAADSELLLLDEPTAGINPQIIKKLLKLIRDLANEGRTIIIIEHNMNIVIEIADWVYFLDEGQVISFGLPQDVLGDPEVRRTYIGI